MSENNTLIKFSKEEKGELQEAMQKQSFKSAATMLERKFGSGNGAGAMLQMLDVLNTDDSYRRKFEAGFNRTFKTKTPVKFEVFTDEEKEARRSYTVTGGSTLADTYETTIMPVINELLISNSNVLSKVSRLYSADNRTNFDLNEFGDELDAENLAETTAGTPADDVIRDGDSLVPNNKVQASTSFSEYAMITSQPGLMGKFLGRLVKRVQNRLVYNIFKGSNATNQFKGIINTAGTTEDDQEGAMAFIPVSPTDNIDRIVQLIGDMPDALGEDNGGLELYMLRSDFHKKVLTVQDLDQNYKYSNLAIVGVDGRFQINGIPVNLVQSGMTAGTVVCANLDYYYLTMAEDSIKLISDDGKVSIKEGITNVVARVWADGGMTLAHKNAVGSGAAANDNQQKNMFRTVAII